MLCRFGSFRLYRRALLSSGGRLRRISGKRHHVDLHRALRIGVVSLICTLSLALFENSHYSGRGVQQMYTQLPKASRAGHADQLASAASFDDLSYFH